MYFCFIGNLYGLCKELKLTRFLNFLAFQAILSPMSFTYNPKKKKRARTHGFLSRMKTPDTADDADIAFSSFYVPRDTLTIRRNFQIPLE
jgi:hypothetical protein